MKTGKTQISRQRRRITFELYAPEAREAFLVGEFNQWDCQAHPMKSNGNGVWTKRMLLPPGQFAYKFFVDSQWVADPHNERTRPDGFGSLNSVVNVLD